MIRMNAAVFSKVVWLLVVLFFYAVSSLPALADEEIWLLVDTKSKVISVKKGKETKAEFRNISIGRNGAGTDKIRGDYKTPLGIYRIGWINPNSRFHKFYGVTYPSRVDAKRGLKKGLINTRTYQSLLASDLLDQVPSQSTRLGGQIGIHGVGSADPEIHKAMNWTRGCIAVTDRQINSLGAWIKKGAVVVIR